MPVPPTDRDRLDPSSPDNDGRAEHLPLIDFVPVDAVVRQAPSDVGKQTWVEAPHRDGARAGLLELLFQTDGKRA